MAYKDYSRLLGLFQITNGVLLGWIRTISGLPWITRGLHGSAHITNGLLLGLQVDYLGLFNVTSGLRSIKCGLLGLI